MRLVLRPLGIVVLLVALSALALLAFRPLLTRNERDSIAMPFRAREYDKVNPKTQKDFGWRFICDPKAEATYKILPASAGPLTGPLEEVGEVLQVTVKKPNPEFGWYVQSYFMQQRPFAIGEAWELRFWARSPDKSPFVVLFETAQEPYIYDVLRRIDTTAEWKYYVVPYTVTRNHGVEQSKVSLQFNQYAGRYEVAGVRLVRVR